MGSGNYLLTPAGNIANLFNTASGVGGTAVRIDGTSTSSSSFVKSIDQDFDLTEFQLPRTIKGDAVVKIGFAFDEIGTSSNYSAYVIAKIRKYSIGTGEVEIASVQSSTQIPNNDTEYGITLNLTVPQTHFKKGEQLRLTIECWVKHDAGTSSCRARLSLFPPNTVTSVFSAGNSRLVLMIPYKLNI